MSFPVYFLSAGKPIVKRYEIDPATNQIVKHPYPFVYEVSSTEETCSSLLDLANLITKYAALS